LEDEVEVGWEVSDNSEQVLDANTLRHNFKKSATRSATNYYFGHNSKWVQKSYRSKFLSKLIY
jgi:hypothetical protein